MELTFEGKKIQLGRLGKVYLIIYLKFIAFFADNVGNEFGTAHWSNVGQRIPPFPFGQLGIR